LPSSNAEVVRTVAAPPSIVAQCGGGWFFVRSFVALFWSCVVWCCSCRVFVCVTCFSSNAPSVSLQVSRRWRVCRRFSRRRWRASRTENLYTTKCLYNHTDTEDWVPRTSLELPDTAHVPPLGQHTSHIVPHTDHSTHI